MLVCVNRPDRAAGSFFHWLETWCRKRGVSKNNGAFQNQKSGVQKWLKTLPRPSTTHSDGAHVQKHMQHLSFISVNDVIINSSGTMASGKNGLCIIRYRLLQATSTTHTLLTVGTTLCSFASSATTSCTAGTIQDADVSSIPTETFYILSDDALTPPTFKSQIKERLRRGRPFL